MKYFLSYEKCLKLNTLKKLPPIVKGDWVYVIYEKWQSTGPKSKELVEVVEKDVYIDSQRLNMEYSKVPTMVKIPTMDDFLEALDADIKNIDYESYNIVSNRAQLIGYSFNNTKENKNLEINGDNMYEAMYNMLMLLYSNEK